MKALVFENNTVSVVEDKPTPSPAPNNAVIQVRKAGICNTDIEIVKGYMGFEGTLGHEFVGTVVECPSDRSWEGKRVCADINAACGKCDTCVRLKDPHHCPHRTVIGIQNHGGAFADYVVAPVANLYPVPETVPDEEAVFTEPVAAAFEILDQMRLTPETKVIVQGDGKLGLLIAQVMRLACKDVLLFGKHPDKMKLIEASGIQPVDIRETDVNRWTQWADVVVEVTGTAAGLQQAMNLCKPRGTIVLKSTVAAGADLNLAPLVIHEITLLGSRCGPFDKALEAMAKNQLILEPLIQGEYSLNQGVKAMEHAQSKGTLKILLTP